MDKSDYKMSQTEMHAFEIHDKPSGALLATITREPGGTWSTHPEAEGPASEQAFDDQVKPQAAFDAFIARITPADESGEPDPSAGDAHPFEF